MQALIKQSLANGKIKSIPSKSYFHRYIIAAMLASGQSEISTGMSKFEMSKDILTTLSAIESLGGSKKIENNFITVEGIKKIDDSDIEIDAFESGSTLRFMIPIALAIYNKVTFKGTPRLIERGIGIYEDIFQEKNIKIEKTQDSYTFIGSLTSGYYKVNGAISSQFVTGLLYSLPLLEGDSTIEIIPPVTSMPYIEITLDVLRKAGIIIKKTGLLIEIKGSQKYKTNNYLVEGDWSNAAFMLAFNYFGGNVCLEGLKEDSIQGDRECLAIFEKMNIGFTEVDLNNIIDLGPILFCFAALKNGAKFIGTKRLIIKESNRLLDMVCELEKIGTKFEILSDDEVIIYPTQTKNKNIEFDAHNDHRLAMSLSVLCSVCGGKINNASSVKKSYPTFFEDLKKLGIDVEYGEDNE